MSAFIVSHDHIDGLLTYAIEHGIHYWKSDIRERVQITAANATAIGRRLLTENCRSVEHRYPADAGSNREVVETYTFRPFAGSLTHTEAAKAAHCLDYQSCEHPGWEPSRAHRIVREIAWTASRSMPGWDAAPWGVRERTEVGA